LVFVKEEEEEKINNYSSKKYRKENKHTKDIDKISLNFDPWSIVSSLRSKNILNEVYKYKKKINSWLDYGGYDGSMLTALKEKKKIKITAVAEMNSNALKIAKFKGHKIINMLNSKIKFKYDVISIVQVLEHTSDPLKILNMLNKNLNNNGLIYLEVPNLFYFPNSDTMHINEFNKISLENLILRSNFKIIKFSYNSTPKFSNKLDWFYNNKKDSLVLILKKKEINIKSNDNLTTSNTFCFFVKYYLGQNFLLFIFAINNLKIFGGAYRFAKGMILFIFGIFIAPFKILNLFFPIIFKKI
jgi:2-polyprenyl-3-methyl-5-hydroxy-6-metoxy-1,4-benzoquinol methylase